MRICYGRYHFILLERVMYLTKSITISSNSAQFTLHLSHFLSKLSWDVLKLIEFCNQHSILTVDIDFLLRFLMLFWDAMEQTQTIKIQTNNISLLAISSIFLLNFFAAFSIAVDISLGEMSSAASNVGCITMFAYYNEFNSSTIQSSRFSSQAFEPNFFVSFAVQISVSHFFFSFSNFLPSLFSSLRTLRLHALVSIYNGTFFHGTNFF